MGSRQPSRTKPATTAKKQLDDRLAQALRENLNRRKAQLRARANSHRPGAAEMPVSAAPTADSNIAQTDDSD